MNSKHKSTGRKKIQLVHFQFVISTNQEIVNEINLGGKYSLTTLKVSDGIPENDIVDPRNLWLFFSRVSNMLPFKLNYIAVGFPLHKKRLDILNYFPNFMILLCVFVPKSPDQVLSSFQPFYFGSFKWAVIHNGFCGTDGCV